MVIFIKVKDNVKNKPSKQFSATYIFFQHKTLVEKLLTVKDRGGYSWTPVSKFQQFRTFSQSNVSVKIRNLQGSQNFIRKTS